ncbi:MAG: hypothetical protein VXU42_05105, partial [Verrucomicrobiota bacterium]|nr:hypothetical protein [Verrucomicrobiota bacterium]
MQKEKEAQFARRVALSDPERIDLNITERSEEKSLSKGEIAAELENRGLGVKRAKIGKKAVSGKRADLADLFQQPIKRHGNLEENSSGNFGVPRGKIPRAVPAAGGKRGKWVSVIVVIE